MEQNANHPHITLINYADKNFKTGQKTNSETGLKKGGVSKVISYSPSDIDRNFYRENKKILSYKRGAGYWLWKPYFIKKTLEKISWNDYVFYSDSGAYFINSVVPFTKLNQDIVVFELTHLEKHWTKRDAFIILDCDSPKYTDTPMRLATCSMWKKTPFTMKFIDEWLNYSKDERALTDQDNVLGKPNYENFKEHRHDQSIFSLLTKKYNLKAYRDPSQFGNGSMEAYRPTSSYPQLIVSTRARDISIAAKIKNLLIKVLKRILC